MKYAAMYILIAFGAAIADAAYLAPKDAPVAHSILLGAAWPVPAGAALILWSQKQLATR